MHHTPIKTIGYVTDVIEISCSKKSAAINDVKTQSSFDLTSNVNWHLNSTEYQFTKISQAYNGAHLMVD